MNVEHTPAAPNDDLSNLYYIVEIPVQLPLKDAKKVTESKHSYIHAKLYEEYPLEESKEFDVEQVAPICPRVLSNTGFGSKNILVKKLTKKQSKIDREVLYGALRIPMTKEEMEMYATKLSHWKKDNGITLSFEPEFHKTFHCPESLILQPGATVSRFNDIIYNPQRIFPIYTCNGLHGVIYQHGNQSDNAFMALFQPLPEFVKMQEAVKAANDSPNPEISRGTFMLQRASNGKLYFKHDPQFARWCIETSIWKNHDPKPIDDEKLLKELCGEDKDVEIYDVDDLVRFPMEQQVHKQKGKHAHFTMHEINLDCDVDNEQETIELLGAKLFVGQIYDNERPTYNPVLMFKDMKTGDVFVHKSEVSEELKLPKVHKKGISVQDFGLTKTQLLRLGKMYKLSRVWTEQFCVDRHFKQGIPKEHLLKLTTMKD